MTEYALAHPYMTGSIVLFGLYVVGQCYCNTLKVIMSKIEQGDSDATE